MSQQRIRMAVVTAALIVLLGAPGAWAQNSSPEADRWQFEFTPYLWAASLSGDVAAGPGPTASIDAGVDDIVKHLDFTAMATFEARRGRWGLLLDAVYGKVSGDNAAPPPFSQSHVEIQMGLIEPAVAFRVWENEKVAIDVLGGARVSIVDTEIKFSGAGLPNTRVADTQTWVDPVVGGRLRVRLAERWVVTLLGDVGGFGIGSDLAWQAFGGVAYEISDTWSLKLGYRAMGVDYESGGFKLDVISHGPVVGVGIRF
jgi:opacity protein-like surface antigen